MATKRKREEDSSAMKQSSVLLSEDTAFPRGGGSSVLTPLEIKQAANEAVRDLFSKEDTSGKAAGNGAPGKKKHRKKNAGSLHKSKGEQENAAKVLSLSYSKLSVGSLVLGQVIEVNEVDLVLSIANNIIGFIPIVNISSKISAKLEAESDDDDNDDDDGSEMGEKLPQLAAMFKVGQWLRAVVVDNGKQNNKKRLELSIEPRLVNESIDDEDFAPGQTVQGSVESVEDHGVIIDIGHDELTGFISKKEFTFVDVNAELLYEGQVFLFSVLSKSKNGRTLTLTLSARPKKLQQLTTVSSVRSIVPGSLSQGVVTNVKPNGVVVKIFDVVEASVDLFQAGTQDISKFTVGDSVQTRVIAKVGDSALLSLLPSVIDFGVPAGYEAFAVGNIVNVSVVTVEPVLGLFVDLGAEGVRGFIHISRVSDQRIDDLSIETKYQKGSVHEARVIGYSHADGLFILSTQKKVIEQKYLRIADIPVGEVIKGEVESILPTGGITVSISENITGYVSDKHISDIKLSHPEKKFKKGMKVTARVLSVDPSRHSVKLTLKKSLVNYDEEIIKSYFEVTPGMKSPGTIVSLKDNGAVLEFFGHVTGYLPVGEISEAFVKSPKDHFRLGQSVAVRVLSVNPEDGKIILSCRVAADNDNALNDLKVCSLVHATVSEKSKDSVIVEIEGGARGVVHCGHLTDGSETKARLKAIKVGDVLDDLVVLDKDMSRRFATLSAKPSLVLACRERKLPSHISDLAVGQKPCGWIKEVTSTGVFIAFANNLTGLASKHDLSLEFIKDPRDKFSKYQSVEAYVTSIDNAKPRFQLSFISKDTGKQTSDLTPGNIVTAKVLAVKETQINVSVGNGVQGRIDASQVFDSYDDIPNKKNTLEAFSKGQEIQARIIGYHDARTHRFLAISHRNASHLVLELSTKPSVVEGSFDADKIVEDIEIGQTVTGYVNNLTFDFAWVNVSPSIKGRMSLLDVTGNPDEALDLEETFPLGSALRCKVIGKDNASGALRLSARAATGSVVTWDNVIEGSVVPALVISVNDQQAILKLSDNVLASVHVTDALDDYTAEPMQSKLLVHEIVKARILSVDGANKKIHASLRESVVSPDSFEGKPVDPIVSSASGIIVGQVLRGVVRNVADSGLFVSLGREVVARALIKNLSDSFLQDWKSHFTVGQVVQAKVLSVQGGKVEISLKESQIDADNGGGISSLKVGDMLNGTVKKVESFGILVQLDGTSVTGLCHRSEVADIPLSDLSKVFAPGDKVKVKVLNIKLDKRRVSLGMKASYFGEVNDSDVDMDSDSDEETGNGGEEGDSSVDDEVRFDDEDSSDSEDEFDQPTDSNKGASKNDTGLSAKFDWTMSILDQARDQSQDSDGSSEDEEDEDDGRRKKRRKKNKIVEDKTATLTTKQPQSVGDFERLLVGSPNSSVLWINYMAFQLQLSEVDKAREIGRRALKAINFREEDEKLNVWIALLNLENSFGTDATLEETFKESAQYMDPKTIYLKMANIFAQSGKIDKAEETYNACAKKFGSDDVAVWITFGQFLFDNDKVSIAQTVPDRAMKQLPKRLHRELLIKFAQLEYRKGAIERGRNLFEGLVSAYPRRVDVWNVYADYEIKAGDRSAIERLFERIVDIKLTMKQARFFFKKWLAYEERHGDTKSSDYVKAKAQEYVSSRTEQEEVEG